MTYYSECCNETMPNYPDSDVCNKCGEHTEAISELKTLKDIECELNFSGKEVREIGLKFSDMLKVEFIQRERDKILKQEAIKWIKSKHCRGFVTRWDSDLFSSPFEALGAEKILKHFFNIAEEDLK